METLGKGPSLQYWVKIEVSFGCLLPDVSAKDVCLHRKGRSLPHPPLQRFESQMRLRLHAATWKFDLETVFLRRNKTGEERGGVCVCGGEELEISIAEDQERFGAVSKATQAKGPAAEERPSGDPSPSTELP